MRTKIAHALGYTGLALGAFLLFLGTIIWYTAWVIIALAAAVWIARQVF